MVIDLRSFTAPAAAGRSVLTAGMLLLIAAVGPAAAQQPRPTPLPPYQALDDIDGLPSGAVREIERRAVSPDVPENQELLRAEAFNDVQYRRQAFVREAIRKKIFHRFEPDLPTCELWVGPRFARLRKLHQTQAASVPWTYCRAQSARADVMLLRDGQTSHQIGKFTADGLTLF